jgi:hypothetical protein
MTSRGFSFEINRTTRAGIGAVRKVGMWPMLMREKTVVYEQDRRHVYEQIGPRLPAKNYRAELLLTPKPGGTDLRWTAPSPRASAGAAR